MRAFIAIELPAVLIETLRAIQAGLIKKAGESVDISWSRPENIHLTLKFLGEIDPVRVEDICGGLERAAEGISPFSLAAGGVGGFPGLKTPRVIWVGIKECTALAELQKNIDERLVELGFEKEDRPFHPHLTLCRIKSAPAGRIVGKAASELAHEANVVFKADSFVLFKSELSPKGAKYSVLKKVILKGNP